MPLVLATCCRKRQCTACISSSTTAHSHGCARLAIDGRIAPSATSLPAAAALGPPATAARRPRMPAAAGMPIGTSGILTMGVWCISSQSLKMCGGVLLGSPQSRISKSLVGREPDVDNGNIHRSDACASAPRGLRPAYQSELLPHASRPCGPRVRTRPSRDVHALRKPTAACAAAAADWTGPGLAFEPDARRAACNALPQGHITGLQVPAVIEPTPTCRLQAGRGGRWGPWSGHARQLRRRATAECLLKMHMTDLEVAGPKELAT